MKAAASRLQRPGLSHSRQGTRSAGFLQPSIASLVGVFISPPNQIKFEERNTIQGITLPSRGSAPRSFPRAPYWCPWAKAGPFIKIASSSADALWGNGDSSWKGVFVVCFFNECTREEPPGATTRKRAVGPQRNEEKETERRLAGHGPPSFLL